MIDYKNLKVGDLIRIKESWSEYNIYAVIVKLEEGDLEDEHRLMDIKVIKSSRLDHIGKIYTGLWVLWIDYTIIIKKSLKYDKEKHEKLIKEVKDLRSVWLKKHDELVELDELSKYGEIIQEVR